MLKFCTLAIFREANVPLVKLLPVPSNHSNYIHYAFEHNPKSPYTILP